MAIYRCDLGSFSLLAEVPHMRIPHLTKLILKTSKFRPEVWSVTKRKSASGDGRGRSPSSRFFSCHERPLLAEKAFDIISVTVCLFTLRFLLKKVYMVLSSHFLVLKWQI